MKRDSSGYLIPPDQYCTLVLRGLAVCLSALPTDLAKHEGFRIAEELPVVVHQLTRTLDPGQPTTAASAYRARVRRAVFGLVACRTTSCLGMVPSVCFVSVLALLKERAKNLLRACGDG